MTERSEDSGQTKLELADRKMLAEIKANLLGASRTETCIGRFRVLDQIGVGSMGVVFAASDEHLKRRVAIKLLHDWVGGSERERRGRLLREAQLLAQLEHPNIVRVLEAGEHEGRVFMAMELVEGKSLDVLQRQWAGDWKRLLSIYVAAGHGLAAAHARDVVHRDFKPHNVLVDDTGRVRVVDFGLARESVGADEQLTVELPGPDEGAIERQRDDHLTGTGLVPGTPAYMAPELFEGQPASPASDQFSFCVALYEAMYGRRPFLGRNVEEVVEAAREGTIPPPPEKSTVPKWLFEVLARGLSASPEARYPSMKELLAELERDRTRPWKLAGLALTAMAAFGAPWWMQESSKRIEWPTSPEPSAELQLRRNCRAEVATLATQWDGASLHLIQPSAAQGNGPRPRSGAQSDVDGLLEVLEPDVQLLGEELFSACIESVSTTHACREEAMHAFGSMLERGEHEVLPVDAVHAITNSLTLCIESGDQGEVGPSMLESPAMGELVEARAAMEADTLADALGHVEHALARADQDDLRLLARTHLLRGTIFERKGDLVSARKALEEALFFAQASDADILAIDVLLESAEVELLHPGSQATAKRELDRARILLQHLTSRDVPLRRAMLREKQGHLELNERQCGNALLMFGDALEIREEAIAMRRAEGRPTEVLERVAADAQLNMANVRLFAFIGDWQRCTVESVEPADLIEQYRGARDRFARAVGNEQHLGLFEYEFSLGTVLLAFERAEEAIEHFSAARDLLIAQHEDEGAIPIADVELALTEAHRQLEHDEALEHAMRAVGILSRHREKIGELPIAEALNGQGSILHELGRGEEASNAYREAISLLENTTETGSQEQLWITLINLALLELERGDHAAARRVFEQSLATRAGLAAQRIELKDGPYSLVVEAWLLALDGKRQRALDLLERAEGFRSVGDLEPAIAKVRKQALASPN